MQKFVLLPSDKYERLLKDTDISSLPARLPTESTKKEQNLDLSSTNQAKTDIINKEGSTSSSNTTLNVNQSDVTYHIKLVPPPGEPEDSIYL